MPDVSKYNTPTDSATSTVNRIKRYTNQVFEDNKADFGLNFTANKRALEKLAVFRSKELKNEVAGYITRSLRKEKNEMEERRRRAAAEVAQQSASEDHTAEVAPKSAFEDQTEEQDESVLDQTA